MTFNFNFWKVGKQSQPRCRNRVIGSRPGQRRLRAEALEPRLMLFKAGILGDPPIHQQLTVDALPFLKLDVLEDIIDEHQQQDITHFTNNDAHFDGCHFQGGAELLSGYLDDALDNADPDNFDPGQVADEFGAALHGAQDFYSHSNWVNLEMPVIVERSLGFWEDTFTPFSIHKGVMLVEGEDDEIPAGYSLSRNGAIVDVMTPAGPYKGVITGYNESLLDDNMPDSIEMAHGELNKDAPGENDPDNTLYPQAVALAIAQTRHEFYRLIKMVESRYGSAQHLLDAWVDPNRQQELQGLMAEEQLISFAGGQLTIGNWPSAVDCNIVIRQIDGTGDQIHVIVEIVGGRTMQDIIPRADVQSIRIIGTAGAENITIGALDSTIPVTVIAGSGADRLTVDRPAGYDNISIDVVSTPQGLALRTLGAKLNVTADGVEHLELYTYGGDLRIGDLSALGESHVLVHGQQGTVGTSTVVEGPASGAPDNIEISHDGGIPRQLSIDGDTLSVEFIELVSSDRVLVKSFGGTVDVSDLSGAELGLLTLDSSGRPTGSDITSAITINNASSGVGMTPASADPNDFRIASVNEPDVLIVGMRIIDMLTANLLSPDLQTTFIDASHVKGALRVNATGNPDVRNEITLAKVGLDAVVTVDGGAAQTTLHFGFHSLVDIRTDVEARSLQLHVNNAAATDGRVLTFTPHTFSGWRSLAGEAPNLFFSDLWGTMTVDAGAGDRYALDGTPATIEDAVFNNPTTILRNTLHTADWSVPLEVNGDWGIYLGRRIHPDGTTERAKHLSGLANVSITFNFNSADADATDVIFDGDLDPAGAQYLINGVDNLHVVNNTIGLDVTINGSRGQDRAYIYMPGGAVSADLTRTGPGTIYFDGKARLAGTNPSAPNSIDAIIRAGDASLVPIGTFDSVLNVFNTVYLLGSMPQDNLLLAQLSLFKVAPSALGSNQIFWGAFVPGIGNTTVYIPNPPAEHYAVLSLSFDPTAGRAGEPPILTTNYPGQTFIDSYETIVDVVVQTTGAPFGTATVRVFPHSAGPVSTSNTVAIDGSQLRGDLQYEALEPNYTTAESLVAGLNMWGGVAKTNLTQTSVNLSHVHPQSNVTLTGIDPISDFHVSRLIGTVADIVQFGGMAVNVGAGLLKNIEGNVTVNKGWLKEVDDRNGTDPGILRLTSTMLSGWATARGITQPTLTFNTLLGELLITGSSVDQFNVVGTPVNAPQVTIRNLSTSGPAVGVYVMGKTVMPLHVNGNFALTVGRQLNPDGTVTAAGLVDEVFNRNTKFQLTSGIIRGSYIFENFELWDQFARVVAPPLTYQAGGYTNPQAIPTPLPVFFNYTGPGQSTLVFDASHQVLTLGGSFSDPTIAGIAPNTHYAGKNDLRYRAAGDVIFGPNIEAFFYGPIENGGTTNRPGPRVVLNNPLDAPIHYIANPASVGGMEQVLVGAALGPVFVEGNGRGTRVELNPLFSMPIFVAGSSLLPGFAAGNVGGFSLLDTVQADITVNNAALRVIADIPLPAGWTSAPSRPDVTLHDDQLLGIAGGTVWFSNLSDSVLTTGNILSGSLDIDAVRMPGLSIQLPAHVPVATDVEDTPTGATTFISTLLSASDTATTAGSISIRGTTGPLALGELFGSGNAVRFTWPLVVGQPIGSLTWADGLSVPHVSIGDNGSLGNILGSILISGDSHINSPIAAIIDGSADASRANVSFGRWAVSQSPDAIFSTAGTLLNSYYVEDLAQAPIYFGTFFTRPRTLSVYGSNSSAYNISGGVTPATVPPTMKLFTGADGHVVYNTGYAGPMSIIGATDVQLTLGTSAAISGYTGLPQILVEQAPSHPQPIELRVDRRTQAPFTPGGSLRLDDAGNGDMSLTLDNTWRVLYPGDPTQLTINYGPLVVGDTGAGGTVISAGTSTIDILGTTGPLRIEPSVAAGSATVRLAPSGNMQAILGDVEIRSNAALLGFTILTLNNSADGLHRDVHLGIDVDGSTRIIGLAPALVKLVGERFAPTLLGGAGGSTYYVDSRIFPLTSNLFTIVGGSTSDFLVGPDLPNTWTIDAANSVRLGANLRANNIRNLAGGNDSDLFRSVNTSGTLAGDLDGGAGFNTLEYVPVPSPFVTDLVGGHAPRITGTVQNIHAVIPEQLSFNAPTNRSDQEGDTISVQLAATSTVGGTLTFGASGLPAGVSINPGTGLISGTITEGAYLNSPYLVTVTVTNGTNSRLRTIVWEVMGDIVPLPGDFNNDGSVDAADYVLLRKNGAGQAQYDLWRVNFGRRRGPASVAGDHNSDGTVDAADYVILRKNNASQATFDEWKANFGNSRNSGSGVLATAIENQTSARTFADGNAALATRAVMVDNKASVPSKSISGGDIASLAVEPTFESIESNGAFEQAPRATAFADSMQQQEPARNSLTRTRSLDFCIFGDDDLLLLATDHVNQPSPNELSHNFDHDHHGPGWSHGDKRRLDDFLLAALAEW